MGAWTSSGECYWLGNRIAKCGRQFITFGDSGEILPLQSISLTVCWYGNSSHCVAKKLRGNTVTVGVGFSLSSGRPDRSIISIFLG